MCNRSIYTTSYRSVMYPVLVTPINPKPAKTMGPYEGKVDAFVLLLGLVSPHGPPFSKIVESTSDGPWIVTHIGQGGMVDDWWHSAPG